MLGALVCTPNPPASNPRIPSNFWFSTNNTTITDNTHTVQTEPYTFNAPTIIHGFRLTSFRLTGVTAVMRLRVNLFRNDGPTSIFQVYFNYSDSRLSGSDAPLFIPFSYAEFARYAAIATNANDVVRIDPMTIVFSRPQHPIFNAGDVFRMEITVTTATTSGVQSQLSVQSIQYAGATNPNTIAGRLSGIILNTPTITIQPNLPVTPVFSFWPSTVRIPIPATSNSTGAFDYNILSQEINPMNGNTTGRAGASVNVVNNELVTQIANFQSRVSIQVFQRSSTIFTRGSATLPINIDLINTGRAMAISTSPSPVGIGSTMTNELAPFNVWIPFNATPLGFSFQFFGGYQRDTTNNITVNVNIVRASAPRANLQITFTQNTSSISVDGTMIYIPFGQSVITNPTFVSNLTYTGSLASVQPGDFVSVNITGANMMTRNRIFSFGLGTQLNRSLIGSLLFSDVTIGIQTIPSFNNFVIDPTHVGASVSRQLYFNFIPDGLGVLTSDIMLIDFRIPNIFLTDVTDALPAPTLENPHRITFTLVVQDGATQVYMNTMIICLISSNTNDLRIPFDMPLPGNALSRETAVSDNRWYYIESLEPDYNRHYLPPTNSDIVTFSYPRIYQSIRANRFSYSVSVNSSRSFMIQNTLNQLGFNRISQLSYIQL